MSGTTEQPRTATHIAAVRVAAAARYPESAGGWPAAYGRGVRATLDWLEAGEGVAPASEEWLDVSWAGRERTRAMDRELGVLSDRSGVAGYYNGVAVTLRWYRSDGPPPA